MRSGHFRRGGSTLTQQLAKNVFLDKEKSLWRKLKEAYLAHAIEKHYKKDFILEKYLNVVEFGDGIYGVRSAALHYFHKSPSELNPLEAAYLAHLLPNPKVYSRSFRSGSLTPFSRKSVSTILRRMEAYHKLSPESYALAINELPHFPWNGLSADSFRNGPGYGLELESAPTVSNMPTNSEVDSDTDEDLHAEEQALEEIKLEDQRIQESKSASPNAEPVSEDPQN